MQRKKRNILSRTTVLLGFATAGVSFAVALSGCAEIQKGADKTFKAIGLTGHVGRTEQVTAYRLNLRRGPSTNTVIVAVLQKGDSLQIESKKGAWLKVSAPGGKTGWVYNRYVSGYTSGPESETDGQAPRSSADDSASPEVASIPPESEGQAREEMDPSAVSDHSESAVSPVEAAGVSGGPSISATPPAAAPGPSGGQRALRPRRRCRTEWCSSEVPAWFGGAAAW